MTFHCKMVWSHRLENYFDILKKQLEQEDREEDNNFEDNSENFYKNNLDDDLIFEENNLSDLYSEELENTDDVFRDYDETENELDLMDRSLQHAFSSVQHDIRSRLGINRAKLTLCTNMKVSDTVPFKAEFGKSIPKNFNQYVCSEYEHGSKKNVTMSQLCFVTDGCKTIDSQKIAVYYRHKTNPSKVVPYSFPVRLGCRCLAHLHNYPLPSE